MSWLDHDQTRNNIIKTYSCHRLFCTATSRCASRYLSLLAPAVRRRNSLQRRATANTTYAFLRLNVAARRVAFHQFAAQSFLCRQQHKRIKSYYQHGEITDEPRARHCSRHNPPSSLHKYSMLGRVEGRRGMPHGVACVVLQSGVRARNMRKHVFVLGNVRRDDDDINRRRLVPGSVRVGVAQQIATKQGFSLCRGVCVWECALSMLR